MELLEGSGIRTYDGAVVSGADGAFEFVSHNPGNTVLKAQVLAGGRGKAGGVRIVSSPDEARRVAGEILAMTIKGNAVKKLVVARAVDVRRELYAAVFVNPAKKCVECMVSGEGGVEIEETAIKSPEKIARFAIPGTSFPPAGSISGALSRAIPGVRAEELGSVLGKMFGLLMKHDCSLVEINPLAMDDAGDIVALDAKITIDDNALYRHPELERYANPEEYSADEREARKASLSYVSLDGNIGCMVNGAGLAMATMDLIKHFGGAPANFLDIGGSSNPRKVVDGLAILRKNPSIKAILLNIFGGITRCDDIASGLIEAQREFRIDVPLVIRLIGTNDEKGIRMLVENGFTAFPKLTDAVKAAVEKSGRHAV